VRHLPFVAFLWTRTVPSFEAEAGLSFVPRSQPVTFVESDEDMTLCGAGPPCP